MNESSMFASEQTDNPLLFKPKRKTHLKVIIGMSIVGVVAIGVVIGLMWQSNSFIAKNQDIRSDASVSGVDLGDNLAIDSVAPASSGPFIPGRSYLSPVDQRVAVTGATGMWETNGCSFATRLGLGWTYNWGGISNKDARDGKISNEGEIRCYTNTKNHPVPVQALLTVAKNDYPKSNDFTADGEVTVYTSADVARWLDKAKADNKWRSGTDDQALRMIREGLFPDPSCDIVGHESNLCGTNNAKRIANFRLAVDYIQLPYMSDRYPGAYYQVANEPDFGLSFYPSEYAKLYKVYYDRIKYYDPSAQVAVGGIGIVDFDHEVNVHDETTTKNTAAGYIRKRLSDEGLANNQKNKDIAWLRLVFHEYSKAYGGVMPVDFWSIHPYAWTKFVTQRWPIGSHQQAINDTVAQVDAFKAAVSQPDINRDRPIWITEVNLLPMSTHGTRDERETYARDMQKPFMTGIFDRLIGTGKVQKIFWFNAATEPPNPTGFTSYLVYPDAAKESGFNVLGQELLRQKNLRPDTALPEIMDVVITSVNQGTAQFKIKAHDPKPAGSQNPSGLASINYAIFTSTTNPPTPPSNQKAWRTVFTKLNETNVTSYFPSNQALATSFLAVQVRDAYGNASAAKVYSLVPYCNAKCLVLSSAAQCGGVSGMTCAPTSVSQNFTWPPQIIVKQGLTSFEKIGGASGQKTKVRLAVGLVSPGTTSKLFVQELTPGSSSWTSWQEKPINWSYVLAAQFEPIEGYSVRKKTANANETKYIETIIYNKKKWQRETANYLDGNPGYNWNESMKQEPGKWMPATTASDNKQNITGYEEWPTADGRVHALLILKHASTGAQSVWYRRTGVNSINWENWQQKPSSWIPAGKTITAVTSMPQFNGNSTEYVMHYYDNAPNISVMEGLCRKSANLSNAFCR